MLVARLGTVLAIAAMAASGGSDDPDGAYEVSWTKDICNGTVTDGLCCPDKHCEKRKKKDKCEEDVTCVWKNDECVLNRDHQNNVCCLDLVDDDKNFCDKLVKLRCPKHFQVDDGCCDSKVFPFFKSSAGKVCCNKPCAGAASNSACSEPKDCKDDDQLQLMRSFWNGDPNYQAQYNWGFNSKYLKQPVSVGFLYGLHGFETHHSELPDKDNEGGKGEEITVDDMMNSLIEALSNDKDVFEYAQEVYSDPTVGKVYHGGHLGGLNYVDPLEYIEHEAEEEEDEEYYKKFYYHNYLYGGRGGYPFYGPYGPGGSYKHNYYRPSYPHGPYGDRQDGYGPAYYNPGQQYPQQPYYSQNQGGYGPAYYNPGQQYPQQPYYSQNQGGYQQGGQYNQPQQGGYSYNQQTQQQGGYPQDQQGQNDYQQTSNAYPSDPQPPGNSGYGSQQGGYGYQQGGYGYQQGGAYSSHPRGPTYTSGYPGNPGYYPRPDYRFGYPYPFFNQQYHQQQQPGGYYNQQRGGSTNYRQGSFWDSGFQSGGGHNSQYQQPSGGYEQQQGSGSGGGGGGDDSGSEDNGSEYNNDSNSSSEAPASDNQYNAGESGGGQSNYGQQIYSTTNTGYGGQPQQNYGPYQNQQGPYQSYNNPGSYGYAGQYPPQRYGPFRAPYYQRPGFPHPYPSAPGYKDEDDSYGKESGGNPYFPYAWGKGPVKDSYGTMRYQPYGQRYATNYYPGLSQGAEKLLKGHH